MTAGQAPGSGVSCKVSVTGDPPQSEILSENSRNNAEVLKRSYRIALLSCSSLLAVAINLFLRLNRNFITDQETGPERTTGEPHNAFSPAPPPVEEARPQEVSCHRGWRRCPGGAQEEAHTQHSQQESRPTDSASASWLQHAARFHNQQGTQRKATVSQVGVPGDTAGSSTAHGQQPPAPASHGTADPGKMALT